MSLIFVALGAILLWFLIAPFLKPGPAAVTEEADPRVTCSVCDELRDPDQVIEREFGAGRFHYICGACLADMTADFTAQHGTPPSGGEAPADRGHG